MTSIRHSNDGSGSGQRQAPVLLLERVDLERLAAGTHDDPFRVLGPHVRNGRRVLAAIDPGAAAIYAVLGDDQPVELARQGDTPIFAAVIPDGSYRLRATDGTNDWDSDDAYRFGPVLGELDEHLLAEGTHLRLWHVLGAHQCTHECTPGTRFAVWAPNAQRVSVIGDFNAWDGRRHVMRRRGTTGVWELFIPGLRDGCVYKYELRGHDGALRLKADPLAFGSEHPPKTASIVRDLSGYGWRDDEWMATRQQRHDRRSPISIYEVHLGSWRRKRGDSYRPLSYKEAAHELVDYVKDLGFTHLELLPVSEFPFDGSWGYQPTGLFAPTIRFGPPHEFRDLVDAAHRAGLGVLVDWVPGHFPTDEHGLGQFDGTPLYEHADPREGFHRDWNTLIYNFGRTEVANFLVANALYWLEEYHLDGLRVDAVASMLYRDYSRPEGEWIPNRFGGRENLEAVALLQRINRTLYGEAPGIMTAAEESTAYPGVSTPVHEGGLGFGYKWNMGWMNDTLRYISKDPIHRQHHHHDMTFGIHYAFSENFILPISHDEVVHGKGSMLERMPGHRDDQFANLRAYYGFMWGHPGKKLLFMGCEFGQPHEWNHNEEIDWAAAEDYKHAGVRRLVADLNRLYRQVPALHQLDAEPAGFQWIDSCSADESVYAWIRRGQPEVPEVVVVCNFTPVERRDRHIGLPAGGRWVEILNTDSSHYGGENRGNSGGVEAESALHHGQPFRATMTLPPLSTIFLQRQDART